MNTGISQLIATFSETHIPEHRRELLRPLIQYVSEKVKENKTVSLNFICTHNSRRSHLCQIWAQTMAAYWNIKNIFCYSGGTEATAMFYKIAETLSCQGFDIIRLSENHNPVYAVRYDSASHPVICFSKEYQHPFNPSHGYAAVVTCDSADEACPVVLGAERRFPVKYQDPKAFDHTEFMTEKYRERSLKIAQEMWYVFSQI
jgi:arsenate reductase